MRRKTLIGITGLIGSGKDTVGNAVKDLWREEIEKDSFARPLKQMIAKMLNVPYAMVDGTTDESRKWRETVLPDIGKTPRELMLSLGTEWGRDLVHFDLWVILAARRFKRAPWGVYFPDVRFDNEAAWIKRVGGVILKTVKTIPLVDCGEAELGLHPQHRSEGGISSVFVDRFVYAEPGDLDGLQSEAMKALKELGACPSG